MFSLIVCMHNRPCFHYVALRDHRSVPQQATSYSSANRQIVYLHKWPLYLSDGHALILGWCACAPLVCVHMNGVAVLYVVRL